MIASPLERTAATTAAEICARFPLGDEAKQRLDAGMTPRQFLERLIEGRHDTDAVRFLAHALPKREAVWWACLCARRVAGADPAPAVEEALQAAERWAADPSEENRRAALPRAEAAGWGTPAGCAAAASFWSGGSLSPPDLPAVPPGDDLTAQGVAGAVLLATVATDPARAPENLRAFLALGSAVADGTNRWPEAAAQP